MSSKQGHRAEKKEGKVTWPKILQAEPRISSPSEGKMTRHWKEK